jgi:hypothetical protein
MRGGAPGSAWDDNWGVIREGRIGGRGFGGERKDRGINYGIQKNGNVPNYMFVLCIEAGYATNRSPPIIYARHFPNFDFSGHISIRFLPFDSDSIIRNTIFYSLKTNDKCHIKLLQSQIL